MASQGSGYDLSPTTFSPEGRIFQVEYATKAVEKAGTALAIRCADGVVLGVEKMLHSKLLKPGSNRQLHSISRHTGIAFSGWAPDARQLIQRGRSEAEDYEEFYGSPIPPAVLAERLAQFVHYFTLHGALRPFGAGAIIAGYDPETREHSLHMIEPNGVQYRYFGTALGKGRQVAKTEIERLDLKNITCAEALKEIIRIVLTLQDDNTSDASYELELSWMGEQTGWVHQHVPQELREQAEKQARSEMEEEDDEEDGDAEMS